MINLFNTHVENLSIHKVGNKNKAEEIFLSERSVQWMGLYEYFIHLEAHNPNRFSIFVFTIFPILNFDISFSIQPKSILGTSWFEFTSLVHISHPDWSFPYLIFIQGIFEEFLHT